MKILNVISWGYETGGAESHVRSTNELLRTRGHQVITLSSDSGLDKLRYDEFQFRTVPTRGLRKLLYTAYNPHSLRVVRSLLHLFQPDVVILHTLTQATASTVLAVRDVPTLLCIHGPEHFTLGLLNWTLVDGDFKGDSHELKDLTWRGRLHHTFYRYVCRPLYLLGIRRVDATIAYSRFVTDLLRSEGIPATYLPMGVSLFPALPFDPSRSDVLFVGRLVPLKGAYVLLEAFTEVARHFPQATLTLAGEGEAKEDLKEMVRRSGLERSVRFLGHVPANQIGDLYAQATVVVMPSIFPEAFGKVGVEAMSAGRPVVGSDVGGVRDWLHHGVNGMLVRPGESGDVAAALIELLGDHRKVEQMGQAARQTAEQFALGLHVDRLEELLREVRSRGKK